MTESAASEMLRRHYTQCTKARVQCESENATLVKIRTDILSAISIKNDLARGKTSREDDIRLYLIAQYLIGIDLSYIAIVEGIYAQAANLQKQQIETLARLEEETNGKQRQGKTPNVNQPTMPGLGRQYGLLNDAAHPSKSEIIKEISQYSTAKSQGASSDPRFIQEFCEPLLSNHCVYLLHLWRHMANLFLELFDVENDEKEAALLESAIMTLRDIGAIVLVAAKEETSTNR